MPPRKTKKPRSSVKRTKVTAPCVYCKADKNPDYKDYKDLEKFLTDRAKIVGKRRTGVCSKHQRRLSVAIKRARYLGLLPFTPEI